MKRFLWFCRGGHLPPRPSRECVQYTRHCHLACVLYAMRGRAGGDSHSIAAAAFVSLPKLLFHGLHIVQRTIRAPSTSTYGMCGRAGAVSHATAAAAAAAAALSSSEVALPSRPSRPSHHRPETPIRLLETTRVTTDSKHGHVHVHG